MVSSLLVLVSLATLPALLESLAGSPLAFAEGGALGRGLARGERVLLSGPGALALNSLLLFVGLLGWVGVAPAAPGARLPAPRSAPSRASQRSNTRGS